MTENISENLGKSKVENSAVRGKSSYEHTKNQLKNLADKRINVEEMTQKLCEKYGDKSYVVTYLSRVEPYTLATDLNIKLENNQKPSSYNILKYLSEQELSVEMQKKLEGKVNATLEAVYGKKRETASKSSKESNASEIKVSQQKTENKSENEQFYPGITPIKNPTDKIMEDIKDYQKDPFASNNEPPFPMGNKDKPLYTSEKKTQAEPKTSEQKVSKQKEDNASKFNQRVDEKDQFHLGITPVKNPTDKIMENIEKNNENSFENRNQLPINAHIGGKTVEEIMQNPLPTRQELEDKKMQEIMRYNPNNNISLEMLKQHNIITADLQTVIRKNPQLLTNIQPGETGKKLARAADTVRGRPHGDCLGGVQYLCECIGIDKYTNANSGYWPKLEKYSGGYNSACNVKFPLEASGKFVNISLTNEASKEVSSVSQRVAANAKMRELDSMIPQGVITSLDNRDDGKRPTNASERHGHTYTKNTQGINVSDGIQRNGIDFSRYGDEMYLSIPLDSQISQNLLAELVSESINRQVKEGSLALKEIEHKETLLAMNNSEQGKC